MNVSISKTTIAPESGVSFWDRAADWVEARSGILAIVLCACFAGLMLAIAARRPFWCDEIITVTIARAPTIPDLFADFRLSFDQTPPLNAILVRAFSFYFGWTELAARLPSVIFATGGLLLIFHLVRRLTNGLLGLASMSILLVTVLPSYAYEARPYAMLFFASALALWFWTSEPDASTRRSTGMSISFGLAMMLAVFAHYYAVLLILPFAADELQSRKLRRIPSFTLLCGALGIGLALAIQSPFIRAASQFRKIPFGGIPSFQNLQWTYVELLARLISVSVCMLLLFAWGSSRKVTFVEGQSRYERLGWFFLGIPLAGYVLAEFVTHAFRPRYFISVLAGLGLAFGCSLYRWNRGTAWALLTLLVAGLLFAETSVSHFRYARTPVVSRRAEDSDFADTMLPRFRKDKKLYVLVPTLMSYVEARYYAPNPQMIRVLLPPNYPLWFISQNPIGIRYFSMADLRRYGRETAFVAPSPDLLSTLDKLGFHIRWRMTQPEAVVYLD